MSLVKRGCLRRSINDPKYFKEDGEHAWINESKTNIGHEINFKRYFYKYTPPRPLDEIEADLKQIEKEIADMLAEMTE